MNHTDLPQGAVRLPHWGLIRAQGADAASFLNGQLTQEMLKFGEAEARLAGYCSPKGRLLASFVVWRAGADELLLACSAEVLPATLKRLSMYVLRAKCKLSDASAEFDLYGLTGAAAAEALGPDALTSTWERRDVGGATVIRLPDSAGQPRWLRAAPAGMPGPALPELPLSAWQWLEVASGVPTIVGATVEQFVPQMVNLELVGGVNFQKGCYPGQEIVARSQYRGTLKRRTYLFEAAAPAAAGQEVFASSDPSQPAGLVANAASHAGRHAVLVELKIGALDDTLTLGSPDGARLQPAELPYAVPLPEAG